MARMIARIDDFKVLGAVVQLVAVLVVDVLSAQQRSTEDLLHDRPVGVLTTVRSGRRSHAAIPRMSQSSQSSAWVGAGQRAELSAFPLLATTTRIAAVFPPARGADFDPWSGFLSAPYFCAMDIGAPRNVMILRR